MLTDQVIRNSDDCRFKDGPDLEKYFLNLGWTDAETRRLDHAVLAADIIKEPFVVSLDEIA
jgi:hypothetical protein